MISQEEHELISNWFKKTFPKGFCPMCQSPFYSDDPTYVGALLYNHRVSLLHVGFVNGQYEQTGEGTVNFVFRCQSCAHNMLFDEELVKKLASTN
jgi:hypothetical protein